MQDSFAHQGEQPKLSVALRFWLLLGLILTLALVCSTLAIRFVALPFLSQYQHKAVTEQAEKVASSFESYLAKEKTLMDFVASDPNVLDIALGFVDAVSYLPDRLESLPKPDELSWVTLYDAFGETIVDYDIRGQDRLKFPKAALESLTDALLEGPLQPRAPVLLITEGTTAFLVMATQVKNNGYTEGLLVFGSRVDQDSFFPANGIVQKTYLLSPQSVPELTDQTIVSALKNFALSIALVPDADAVQAAGNELLTNSVAAIAMVLVGAFGLFALLGRRVIVEPHQKLEIQQRELAELAEIAKRATDAILVTDLWSRVVWANPAFEELSGYKMDEIRGKVPGNLFHGKDTKKETTAAISQAILKRQAIQVEIVYYGKSGQIFWVDLRMSPLLNVSNECYGFVSISNDITKAREQRESIIAAKHEIEHQALHDPLTGLSNRRALDRALKERGCLKDCLATIVRIDLDHFKYVNDTMGHDAGDFALVEVARILREETKASDLAARVGGDEFVLLLRPLATVEDAKKLANRMLTRIREPMPFENKILRVGASFGVASVENGLLGLDELIIGADSALYEAKELGRNRIRLYTPELHSTVLARRNLARELRRAVAEREFEPYFQPQFDAQTLEITGVETLARWHSPDLGLVLPGRFLPVAEQLSIVEEIDDIIFSKAIEQIEGLILEGLNIPKLSVNVTAERIHDPQVYDTVMAHRHIVPEIAFEILESVLVEDQTDRFKFGLDKLRDSGIKIEVDDFGSGHASIVGLMHLRPDAMKIDQRLIMPITTDPLARGMLKSIVGMAGLMKLNVIAEGVETMEHAEILRKIGVDTLQGYAFAKPMPESDLREFVGQHEASLNCQITGSNHSL